MSRYRDRSIVLLVLGLAGLLISILAGAQEHLTYFQSLCPTACKDTAEVKLLHLSFWIWGVVFYAFVLLLAWFGKGPVFWIAAPAAGMETALVWILFRMKEPCLYCIANAAVVFLILVFSFEKKRFWQGATLALLFLLASVLWVPYENNLFASAPRSGGESGVAATVGDEDITNQRLAVLLGDRLFDLKKEIYRMKIEKLDRLIVETILRKEAGEKGKPVDEYLNEIASSEKIAVSDQDVDDYIRENQDRLQGWTGTVVDLRNRVRQYLEQQKKSQKVNDYARSLDAKYGVRIHIARPERPSVQVDTRGAPSLGPPDAPVTVIEFSDYECPACRATHATVEKVREHYGNRVRWIFKDYPLRRHKEAFKAAEAAHCAGDQGKFWEYQNLLFTKNDLDVDSMVKYATELGLSADALRECLQEGKYKATVENNIRQSEQTGLDRTPSFIINGAVFAGGPSFDTFKAAIDEDLRKAGKASKSNQ